MANSDKSHEIFVDVEPRSKNFKIEIFGETKVEEVISTLTRRCEDEGISMAEWGRNKVGSSNVSFVLLRKSTGSTALAPSITFNELFPEINDLETFKLDARAIVG